MKYTFIFGILFLLACSSEEEPDISFFLSKDWKMTEASINGQLQEIDFSSYRLKLNEDLTYSRTGLGGNEDQGTWSLTNGNTFLVLNSDVSGNEEYLIVELQFRLLELQIIQSSDKVGSTEFRYVLEPTRP